MPETSEKAPAAAPAPLKFTRKVRLDRIGSATSPARLGPIAEISEDVAAEEGAIVVFRARGERKVYGEIELPSGRMSKVVTGNIVAGVFGARQALHGYMGEVPKAVKEGDMLSLLNIGGVCGVYTSASKQMGAPIPLEVLGQVIRNGKPLNIKDFALPPSDAVRADGPPLLLVLGTCMNAGKTYAAGEAIRLLSHSGIRVAAGKLSGVAALKDILTMQDNGAVSVSSFLHCGLPSTVNAKDLAAVARSVIFELERSEPELIVLELGDGIIGGYNLGSILDDQGILRRTKARILCANDLVGAWGGINFLRDKQHTPQIISGPVTDNSVGTSYITREMHIPCANARNEPIQLAQLVADVCGFKVEVKE
ncbi:hypothetical protein IT570_02545 [Candidatus Sumerlaeota bacterium]|nr:hypothetical protein [Candidatus Sumerlaeota bacterium]